MVVRVCGRPAGDRRLRRRRRRRRLDPTDQGFVAVTTTTPAQDPCRHTSVARSAPSSGARSPSPSRRAAAGSPWVTARRPSWTSARTNDRDPGRSRAGRRGPRRVPRRGVLRRRAARWPSRSAIASPSSRSRSAIAPTRPCPSPSAGPGRSCPVWRRTTRRRAGTAGDRGLRADRRRGRRRPARRLPADRGAGPDGLHLELVRGRAGRRRAADPPRHAGAARQTSRTSGTDEWPGQVVNVGDGGVVLTDPDGSGTAYLTVLDGVELSAGRGARLRCRRRPSSPPRSPKQ